MGTLRCLRVLMIFYTVITIVFAQGRWTSVDLLVGESSRFDCRVGGKSSDVVYTQSRKFMLSWTKTQEDTPVPVLLNRNIYGQNSQMSPSLRSHVDFELGNESTLNIQLVLSDVRLAESGLYTCIVIENDFTTVHNTYNVRVLDPVQELLLYSNPDTSQITSPYNTTSWAHQPVVRLSTTTDGYVACVARGGYPQPVLNIYVSNIYQIYDKESIQTRHELLGEQPYERTYYSTQVLSFDNYRITPEENDKIIKCEAIIKNDQIFQRVETSARLSVVDEVSSVTTSAVSAFPRVQTGRHTDPGLTTSTVPPSPDNTTTVPSTHDSTPTVPPSGESTSTVTVPSSQDTTFTIIIAVIVPTCVIAVAAIIITVLVLRHKRQQSQMRSKSDRNVAHDQQLTRPRVATTPDGAMTNYATLSVCPDPYSTIESHGRQQSLDQNGLTSMQDEYIITSAQQNQTYDYINENLMANQTTSSEPSNAVSGNLPTSQSMGITRPGSQTVPKEVERDQQIVNNYVKKPF